ncbi:DUF421 domain-containing protein [Croceibacterium aestuarii]|uniref:DUF421 domain-containing protein n=1 Tax=Croceibacterium aestuarii TaxID=3064139 RepID=UPI00272DD6CB|nr:YetF domain-containing protein [Croceibacterium sp. D39]
MWFDTWSDIVRILLSAASAYVAVIVLLRVAGKRSLSKLNAFDFVVTVALGSTLASMILLKDTSLADGLAALAGLLLLQALVTWLSLRLGWFKRLIRSEARILLRDGAFLEDAMRHERVTHAEIEEAIRKQGHGDIEDIAAVVLETDGGFSVIAGVPASKHSALAPLLRESDARG